MHTGEFQGNIWGARALDWAQFGEPTSNDLFNAINNKAEVGKHTKLLDIGCGAGGFCKMAADKGATVYGFDASENLLEIARKHVKHVEFKQGDMENLPYPDESFNLVTGINSFQFSGDIVNALKEAKRVSKRNSQVIIVVWGEPERCEATAVMRAIGSFLPPPPQNNSERKPLYSQGAIESLAKAAGLNPGVPGEVLCNWYFPDELSTLRCMLSAGLSSIAIQNAGEQKVSESIRNAIAPYRKPDGSFMFTNTFLMLISKPQN